MMDNNNCRQPPLGAGGGEAAVEAYDWRKHLPPESRRRIVNKIMKTLNSCIPSAGPAGLQELRRIAVRFEERIFRTASSQVDYLRQICLKMLTLESNYQNSVANSMPSNSAANNNEAPDPVNVLDLDFDGKVRLTQIEGDI